MQALLKSVTWLGQRSKNRNYGSRVLKGDMTVEKTTDPRALGSHPHESRDSKVVVVVVVVVVIVGVCIFTRRRHIPAKDRRTTNRERENEVNTKDARSLIPLNEPCASRRPRRPFPSHFLSDPLNYPVKCGAALLPISFRQTPSSRTLNRCTVSRHWWANWDDEGREGRGGGSRAGKDKFLDGQITFALFIIETRRANFHGEPLEIRKYYESRP
jgi:hypothetical protein